MAAPIVSGSAQATEFFAYTSLEKQAMSLIILLTSQENVYNTANPASPSNRATTAVNYETKTVVGQLSCALTDSAITGKLVDSVQTFL
ncbi:hypothetical protein [Nostoc sp.]|uniref:hypothetical protein n=1 Tax=Nostoc sp. TaxID=1180 RepID=UPI002FF701B6